MINSGDTAFVLIAAALVLLMTPGLAFFYGGLVRRKNVLSTLMQCFLIMCIVGIQWALYGYSLVVGEQGDYPEDQRQVGDVGAEQGSQAEFRLSVYR